MKRNNLVIVALFVLLYALSSISCAPKNEASAIDEQELTENNPEDQIKRGQYLVQITGCHDCHSPKKMGPNGPEIIPELMLSGYPAERPIVAFTDPLIKEGFAMFYPDLTAATGPWGVSFAANLTPAETGIGNWTAVQFKRALTEGKYKGLEGSRMLLPPMPWFNFTEMLDEDVNAIFQYLMSINPVENSVPAPIAPENL